MRPFATLALILGAAVAASGCAGPATQLRHQNASLDRDLDAARAELRREKRKNRELATENLVLRDKLETYEVGAARTGTPRLPVEVLAPPGATPPAGDTDPSLVAGGSDLDPDARVVATTDDGTEIVYIGDAAAGRSADIEDAADDAGVVDLGSDDLPYTPDDDDRPPRRAAPARPPRRAAKPAPKPAADTAAASAYEAAVAQVRAHDHEGALTALRAFLERYPRHDLADNAQYWLGEVYYDAKDYPRAIVEFRTAVERYPRGNKVPDALLKLGYCFAQLGQTAKARVALEQVVDTYPKTPPAELAARKLGELK